ncbi:MAG: phosphatidylserine decarboxylase [Acidobacteriota bacterium]|nr:phosphatidylserine decarboxylase [Blastocatellia bacterium]MDW8413156.1 phosphatidylserine decarboxylase [Acidobacteriota bacterium]
MAREAYPYLGVLLSLAVFLSFVGIYFPVGFYLAAVAVAVAAFVAYFFRDPERIVPKEEGICVAPADGTVTRCEPLDGSEGAYLISIFLSPLDVHINRAPIAGRITRVDYVKGRFVPATRQDSSLINEQNIVTIEDGACRVIVKQVAGIVARRCVLWKREGEYVSIGERLGLIKFSSRTDLVLPSDFKVSVKTGDRVRGGVTIIARKTR